MKASSITHPSDTQLNLWLDGELENAHAAALRTHLDICPNCADRCTELERLAQQVRLAAPESAQCGSEGTFWVHLAGSLGERPARAALRERRPWLRLVPSIGLAALGGLLDLLVTAVLILYSLTSLGLLPGLGSQLLANLPSSGLAIWLERIGLADPAALQAWLANLSTAGITSNDLALFVALLALSLALAVVVGLLLLWHVPRIAPDDAVYGESAHAIR